MLPFHLCQPGEGASCGACCGLYNFRDHSRAALTSLLDRQTEAVRDVPRTREAFLAVAEASKSKQAAPAYPDVRVCPLLGFLDEGRTRVGCLAHPLQTGGIDLRDCGVYTARVCQDFECPSFIWLTPAQARLVRAACPDWYLYGLVITDVELVRAALGLVERALGGPVDPDQLVACPPALEALRRLFRLKEQADGRDRDGIFGRFAPDAEGKPGLRTLDYQGMGVRAALEDDLVMCLGYAPTSREALEEARAQVSRPIEEVSRSIARARSAAQRSA
jgi:hypothetical protein